MRSVAVCISGRIHRKGHVGIISQDSFVEVPCAYEFTVAHRAVEGLPRHTFPFPSLGYLAHAVVTEALDLRPDTTVDDTAPSPYLDAFQMPVVGERNSNVCVVSTVAWVSR